MGLHLEDNSNRVLVEKRFNQDGHWTSCILQQATCITLNLFSLFTHHALL